MNRQAKTLISNAANATTGEWFETGGYIHSVDATLVGSAAVIEIYGSNSGDGAGCLIGTITLNGAAGTSDGAPFPEESKGWMMVRAKVVSTTGGVKSVAACVGEE